MKSYNHFSGDQRAAAQRWLNMMIATKQMKRPVLCQACGNGGIVDMHAEDYSEPFTIAKTAEFSLCLSCHMAVHFRFANPSSWDLYRAMLEGGRRFPVFMSRNIGEFAKRFTRMHATIASDWVVRFNVPGRKPDTLDVIDGWLLAKTGKGWR